MSRITFNKIPIHPDFGKTIYDIYHVIDNGRSTIKEFYSLPSDVQDDIKDLVSNMATMEKVESDKVTYNLKSRSYGEIRPWAHRFFFFRKCGKNYIFFGYTEKKTRSLSSEVYDKFERKMKKYEREFEKFINEN